MSPDMQQYEEPGAKPRWLGQLRAKQERLTRLETDKLPGIRCICEQFVGRAGECFTCDRIMGYTEDVDDIGLAPAEEE